MKLEIVLSVVITMMTISAAYGATDNEVFLHIINCTDPLSQSYSCDRIALYLFGECEQRAPIPTPASCKDIADYVVDNGLGNQRRLTQSEVVEDFRILEQMRVNR